MKCSKACFAFRPRVENLESRLQPGSLLTGPGYGWSLLADHLSILKQDSLDSQRRVSPSASESSRPTPTSTPVDLHSYPLEIAVASVAAARTESSSRPTSNLFDDLTAGLMNDGLSNLSLTGHGHSVPLAAVATPTAEQPAPATPVGSVPHSPIGVATPAQPAVVNGPSITSPTTLVTAAGSGHHAIPARPINLDRPTPLAVTGWQTMQEMHTAPVRVGDTSSGLRGSGNQATINFLSYAGSGLTGGPGPDSINSVAVRIEGGVNVIYLAGTVTDNTGRTDGFVAKLTDGATSLVWGDLIVGQSTAGPDTASGLEVTTTGVYVVGAAADSSVSLQTDAYVAKVDLNTGALINAASLANAQAAAVTTDAAGNVDIAGSIADPNTAGRQDVAFVQLTSDLSTQNFGVAFPLTIAGVNANSAVTTGGGVSLADGGPTGRTTGGGLIVDNQGIMYFAGTIGAVGDPNNDTQALYGRVNASGTALDWGFRFVNTDTNGTLSPGPGGMGTAVAFDNEHGHVVFTGSMNDNGGTLLNQDLILGRVAQAPNPDGGANVIDANQIWVDNRVSPAFTRVGDWTGNDLTILPDGTSVVTGAAYDPAAGTGGGDPSSVPTRGIDVHVTHFAGDDQTTTQNSDEDPENTFGGSGTDVGRALTFAPSSPSSIYVVGNTNSTDLPTTSGVLLPSYGGTTTTGFVGQLVIA